MNPQEITPSDMVHLHVHTDNSVLDGINRTNTLPARALELGQTAMAITDHGICSGHYDFWKSCNKAGVQPILGMEAYYTIDDRQAKEKDADGENYYHLVLLAKNNQGLKNLYKLSSYAFSEGFYHHARIDDDLLGKYSQDLIATTSCLGSRFSQLILKGRKNEAERLVDHHMELFKDNFLVELQTHTGEQQIVNEHLIDIARRKNLPLILTGDSHYTCPEDKQIHEMTLAIQTKAKLWTPKRFSFGDLQVHISSAEECAAQLTALGLPLEAISNTAHVAKMVNSADYFMDTKNHYPVFFKCPEGMTSWDYLEQLAWEKLHAHFGGEAPVEYTERVAAELLVIKQMGFYDYVLILWDMIRLTEAAGILVGPGRGSAGGCLILYLLGVTKIDPIKYGLIMERWLNVGRAATPLIFDQEMIAQVANTPAPPSQQCTAEVHQCTPVCSHAKPTPKLSLNTLACLDFGR